MQFSTMPAPKPNATAVTLPDNRGIMHTDRTLLSAASFLPGSPTRPRHDALIATATLAQAAPRAAKLFSAVVAAREHQ